MLRQIQQPPVVDPGTRLITRCNGSPRCANVSVHAVGGDPQRDSVFLERVHVPGIEDQGLFADGMGADAQAMMPNATRHQNEFRIPVIVIMSSPAR